MSCHTSSEILRSSSVLSEGVWAVSVSGKTDFLFGRHKDKH